MPQADLLKVGSRQIFDGPPVRVRYRPNLCDSAGNPAHAASWIRARRIILDPELKRTAGMHRRILLHEYFHFAWVRLGNPRRLAWEAYLVAEWKARARGEAGWSAEWRKRQLSARDVAQRSRRWREYCCESFCDTAAWVNRRPQNDDNSEVTLSATRRAARREWFRENFRNYLFAI
jgi:hypothetical protein